MAHYTGSDMELELDDSVLSELRELNIPEDHPAPDTTHAADDDGTSIPGGITYRVGCTATFVDDDAGATWALVPSGTTGTMEFYPLGRQDGYPEIIGDIVITNRTRLVPYNDVVVFTITFNITGSLSYGSYTQPE